MNLIEKLTERRERSEAAYRGLFPAVLDDDVDVARVDKALAATFRTVADFDRDCKTRAARDQAAADRETATANEREASRIEREDEADLRRRLADFDAETARRREEIVGPLRVAVREKDELRREAGEMRRNAVKVLQASADPEIDRELNRLHDERRRLNRRAENPPTEEEIQKLRNQAAALLREAEKVTCDRYPGSDREYRENAARCERRAKDLEAVRVDAREAAAGVVEVDERIASLEASRLDPSQMAWTRGTAVSAAAGDVEQDA